MNKALLSSKKMDYCTPGGFFRELDKEFCFTLDAAATEKSAKCAAYYTPETDGLTKPWNVAGGCCVLQSAIRAGDWEMGAQGVGGSQERNHHCAAHSRQNGHKLFSRLHTGPCGNTVGARAAAVRGRRWDGLSARAVPVHGSGLQRKGREA